MASPLRNIEAERNTVRRVCLRHFQTVQHRDAVIRAGGKKECRGSLPPGSVGNGVHGTNCAGIGVAGVNSPSPPPALLQHPGGGRRVLPHCSCQEHRGTRRARPSWRGRSPQRRRRRTRLRRGHPFLFHRGGCRTPMWGCCFCHGARTTRRHDSSRSHNRSRNLRLAFCGHGSNESQRQSPPPQPGAEQ